MPDPVEEQPSDFAEHTTISSRRQRMQHWILTLPGGVIELVSDVMIIGRAPEFSSTMPTARLVAVSDPTRSVSKNHAAFTIRNGTLVVHDLGSTNGVIVTQTDGREIDLGARGSHELAPGARVELGDVVLTVGKM